MASSSHAAFDVKDAFSTSQTDAGGHTLSRTAMHKNIIRGLPSWMHCWYPHEPLMAKYISHVEDRNGGTLRMDLGVKRAEHNTNHLGITGKTMTRSAPSLTWL